MGIRVFHCDDSPAFTELVGFWLADHPDLRLVGAAHESASALDRLKETSPDVVLLDTGLPGAEALGIGDVRRVAPGARVIVYSGFPRASAERFGAEGADAYVRKDDDERDLVDAIRALA